MTKPEAMRKNAEVFDRLAANLRERAIAHSRMAEQLRKDADAAEAEAAGEQDLADTSEGS